MGNNPVKELRVASFEALTPNDLLPLWNHYQKDGSMSYKKGTRFLKDFAVATGTKYNKEKARGMVMQSLGGSISTTSSSGNSTKRLSFRSSKKTLGTLGYDDFERLFVLAAVAVNQKLSPQFGAVSVPTTAATTTATTGPGVSRTPAVPITATTTHSPRTVTLNEALTFIPSQTDNGCTLLPDVVNKDSVPLSQQQSSTIGSLVHRHHTPTSSSAVSLSADHSVTDPPLTTATTPTTTTTHQPLQQQSQQTPLTTSTTTAPLITTTPKTQVVVQSKLQQLGPKLDEIHVRLAGTESCILWIFVFFAHLSTLVNPAVPFTYSLFAKWFCQLVFVIICGATSFWFLRDNNNPNQSASFSSKFFPSVFASKSMTHLSPELVGTSIAWFIVSAVVTSHNTAEDYQTFWGVLMPAIAFAGLTYGLSVYNGRTKFVGKPESETALKYYTTLHITHDLGIAFGMACGSVISIMGYEVLSSFLVITIIAVPISACVALRVATSIPANNLLENISKKEIKVGKSSNTSIGDHSTSNSSNNTSNNTDNNNPSQVLIEALIFMVAVPLVVGLIFVLIFGVTFFTILSGTSLLAVLVAGSALLDDAMLMAWVVLRFVVLVFVLVSFAFAFVLRERRRWAISPSALFGSASALLLTIVVVVIVF
eukprot:TRINITY_DN1933_c0_g1_i1.p1 TRINITY_DN1933_c0_g1~~TRINITY_DN1933_c0_g1_i1.p1  ORF type:complete len:651 (+),score=128.82 TRINITY_DN1933_c0_g1_i1:13-1965(+)